MVGVVGNGSFAIDVQELLIVVILEDDQLRFFCFQTISNIYHQGRWAAKMPGASTPILSTTKTEFDKSLRQNLLIIKFYLFWRYMIPCFSFFFSYIFAIFMTIYNPTPFTVWHQGRPWTTHTPLPVRPCIPLIYHHMRISLKYSEWFHNSLTLIYFTELDRFSIVLYVLPIGKHLTEGPDIKE